MAEYKVSIDNFEGPMDLLLHLIKEKKKDIMDIDLLELTTQYMDYIEKNREHLDIASEYLVTAAYLIEIKSKMILPKPEIVIDSDYEEDQREKLIKRLVEYKKFKELSAFLENKQEERSQYFVKAPMIDLSQYKPVEVELDKNAIPDDLDVYSLMSALQKMYKRLAMQKPLETRISHKEISTEDMMHEIYEQIKIVEILDFEKLFIKEDFSKHKFVIIFLACLILSREQKIFIEQDDNFGRIILKLKGNK